MEDVSIMIISYVREHLITNTLEVIIWINEILLMYTNVKLDRKDMSPKFLPIFIFECQKPVFSRVQSNIVPNYIFSPYFELFSKDPPRYI